jgi:hypothetical protein
MKALFLLGVLKLTSDPTPPPIPPAPVLTAHNTTHINITEGKEKAISSPIATIADLRLTDTCRHEVIMKMEAWLLGAREPSREFITWTFNDMVIRSNHSRLILVDTGTVDDFQVIISTITYDYKSMKQIPGCRNMTLCVTDAFNKTANITLYVNITTNKEEPPKITTTLADLSRDQGHLFASNVDSQNRDDTTVTQPPFGAFVGEGAVRTDPTFLHSQKSAQSSPLCNTYTVTFSSLLCLCISLLLTSIGL